MNLETTLIYVVLAGFLLVLVGTFWLLAVAFRTRFWWGIGVLLGVPALFFIPLHWRRARWPTCTLLLGALVTGLPYAVNFYHERYIDLGPREKMVAGELHLTLTGWDGKDYAILESKPNMVVLQIANPDVTDDTLEYLRGFQKLRELDLNDTKVTDGGLPIIAELPALRELRMRGTKITDEGFHKFLSGKESLTKLDMRGTSVASKSLRAWKSSREGREFLR